MADLQVAVDILGKESVADPANKAADSLSKLSTVALGVGAAVAAAGVAAAAAAYKIGSDFDSAYDTIRVKTGATGDALAGLQDDFRAVAQAVPASFDDIGSAIGQLNARTGLTGTQLQDLSAHVLQFAKLTDSDLNSTIETSTRVFGDWSVSADKQAGALDYLFRASQATGVGVGFLQDKVVQFGGPLRQFGFTFEESVALLGKFQKEGVNTELVMGSMRIALGKFAKEGVDAREGLDGVFAEIQRLGPSAEATALAMQTFGARAGADMAAAILEGRFAIGDLVKQISDSSDTVLSAAEDTADFAEKWTLFANKAKVAVEPLASAVFGLAGTLLDRLTPALLAALAASGPWIAALANGLGPAIDSVFHQAGALAGIFTADVLPTLTLVSSYVSAHSQPILVGLAAALATVVVPAFVAWGIAAASAAAATIVALAPVLLPIAAVGAAAALLYEGWTQDWGGIQEKTAAAWGAIQPVLQVLWDNLQNLYAEVLPELRATFEAVWGAVAFVVGGDVAIIQGVIGALSAFWREHFDAISAATRIVMDAVTTILVTTMDVIKDVVLVALAVLRGDWSGAWDGIRSVVRDAWSGIQALTGDAIALLKMAFDAAGPALMELLRAGIARTIGGVIATVREGAASIAALLPHSLAEDGPLSEPTDWQDVIVANLPSRLDFARKTVAETTVEITESFDALAVDVQESTEAIGEAVSESATVGRQTLAQLAREGGVSLAWLRGEMRESGKTAAEILGTGGQVAAAIDVAQADLGTLATDATTQLATVVTAMDTTATVAKERLAPGFDVTKAAASALAQDGLAAATNAATQTTFVMAQLKDFLPTLVQRIHDYIEELNRIPREIVTTIRTVGGTTNTSGGGGGSPVQGVVNPVTGTTQAPPGSGASSISIPPGGRAWGGPVEAGVPRIVGERGREWFVPDTSGYVWPGSSLAGERGSDIVININAPVYGVDHFQDLVVAAQEAAAQRGRSTPD